MANQITDQRILVHDADSVGPYVNIAGAATGSLDNEIFIQGTGSIGLSVGTSLLGLMYDAGSAQNWSNNVFYFRINCGLVGLLDTKANGGFRIRFSGATLPSTDYFEVYVGGSDSWPTAINGGWVTFVVDIEDARSTAITNGWTGATVPATSAIRYAGYTAITGGVMPRMVDNTWMDAMYRLPDGNAGIRIEGRNAGTTDWSFRDVFTQLGVAAGVMVPTAGGALICNTPIQIGLNDASTHGFESTNEILLWSVQEFAPSDLYGITVVGATSGTVNVDVGLKTGTGDAATGGQGTVIAASSDGVRWFLDAGGADIDAANFYGCRFIHGSDFQIGTAACETIGTTFVDCESATVSNSLFLKNKVVSPATVDGVAFATTDDLTDIRFCSFDFSDGHAIELTTPLDSAQESRGNSFIGSYGGTPGSNPTAASGSTDAAIYNNTGGAVTVSVTNSGDTPSVRNGASASTVVENSVTLTFTGIPNGLEARIRKGSTSLAYEASVTGNTFSYVYSYLGPELVTATFGGVVGSVAYDRQTLSLTLQAGDQSIPLEFDINPSYVAT